METIRSSDTSVLIRTTWRRHIQEDSILHCYRRENIKSDIILGCFSLVMNPTRDATYGGATADGRSHYPATWRRVLVTRRSIT
jgi:hypothetical protein